MAYNYAARVQGIANTEAGNQAVYEQKMLQELARQKKAREDAERAHKKNWWKRGLGKGLVGAVGGSLMGALAGGPIGALAGAGAGLAAGFGGEGVAAATGDEQTGAMLSGMAPAIGGAIGGYAGAPAMPQQPMGQGTPMTESQYLAQNPGGNYGNYQSDFMAATPFNQADIQQALSGMTYEQKLEWMRQMNQAGYRF